MVRTFAEYASVADGRVPVFSASRTLLAFRSCTPTRSVTLIGSLSTHANHLQTPAIGPTLVTLYVGHHLVCGIATRTDAHVRATSVLISRFILELRSAFDGSLQERTMASQGNDSLVLNQDDDLFQTSGLSA